MLKKETLIELSFTTLVVAMIVFPVPPTTIIGVALATNPKTGKYMNKTAYRVTNKGMSLVGLALKSPIVGLINGKARSAEARIQAGLVRL